MSDTDTNRLQELRVDVPRELVKQIRILAIAKDTTSSVIVREALEAFLKKKPA